MLRHDAGMAPTATHQRARRGRAPRGRRRRIVAAVAAVLALAVAACGAGEPGGSAPSRSTASAAPLPAAVVRGLAVEVAQARTDRVARVVELRVRNAGPADLTVVEGRLTTATTVAAAVTEKAREVRAGTTRAVRAPLTAPVCTGPAAGGTTDPAPVVELDVVDAAGRTGTVTVVPTDATDDLRRVHGEDCAAAAVAAGLDVAFDEGLATRREGDALVADLVLRVRPVPGGPHVRLVQVGGTTLLRPAAGPGPWVVDVDSARPPADGRVVLPVVPARCDLHAIAEDKRGTVLGVRAVVDGVAQPEWYVAAPPALLGALHRFVREACGVPDDART